MVQRDCLGKIIFSSCKVLFSRRDALEAELCACMEGISLAIQGSELSICVEMDSVVAVNMVKDRDTDRSIFASLVNEIKHLMSLHTTSVFHINRNQNVVSDYLAKFARIEGRTIVWLGSGPPHVVDLCKLN
uniref:RNase H type-1 domain-containing protein n=1 Tax=Triticum urartu TaxID=4572 RepID=A0A8R7UWG1_TRIUA